MTQRRANTVIQTRPRAGVLAGLGMSLAFAVVMAPLATIDVWLLATTELGYGEPAPFTVRVPHFGGLRAGDSPSAAAAGSVVVARGEPVARAHQGTVYALRARSGDPMTASLACAAAFALLALIFAAYLRRSPRGKLVRTQAVNLALIAGVALALKLALLLTPLSVFLVPVGGAAICAALAVNSSAGLATAMVVAASMGLTAPFSLGVIGVLGIQGLATVLTIGDGHRKLGLLLAGAIGGLFAAMAYACFYYLSYHQAPVGELLAPLASAWLAAFAGGLMSGVAAILALPLYQALLGEVPRSKLIELADLSNPLLRQIAERSPGTWQHSLAMANMAEVAANTIGADGRLVRVGAYYHDLGKSLQPKYFIENLPAGEPSPHDSLPPHVSADAIFAHVTEGVRLARKEGLPERVIDFMHMHHGDGLLEYFWDKCVRDGNERGLTADDFRYPGVRPQTRETAVLAIVDAVEAASRTLKSPDARAIENLVQRIVYGKLHLGQLDESGLSMADLRRLSNSLIETIKHAHHVRVEYPWQKAERDAATAETLPASVGEAATALATPRARQAARAESEPGATTGRVLSEPPLDSLDVPRPLWRGGAVSPAPAASQPPAVDAPPVVDAPPATATAGGEARATAEPSEPTTRGPGVDVRTVPLTGGRAARGEPSEPAKRPLALPLAAPATALPPGERGRRPPNTIPLMADRGDAGPTMTPDVEVESHRAESEDGALEPGTLVVGAPPSTQTRPAARAEPARRQIGDGGDGKR